MAYVKNWHGRIFPCSGEEAAKMIAKRPHAEDRDSGRVMKQGFQYAEKSEYEAQLKADEDHYEAVTRQDDLKLEMSAKGIVLQVADKKDPLPSRRKRTSRKAAEVQDVTQVDD